MIVDAHTHFWQEGFLSDAFHEASAIVWAAAKEGRTPEMIMEKLANGVVDPDGTMFIENMDRAGVDISLIVTLDAGKHWSGQEPQVPLDEQFAAYNELEKKYDGRLRFLAFADPRRPDCIALMEKAVDEYGFVGCGELVPEGYGINDDIVQPLLGFCAERNLPVGIHTRTGTGIDISGADKTKANFCHPDHIEKVAKRYPDLKVIIAHVGFPIWWESACRVAMNNPNCYLELSNWMMGMSSPEELIPKLACMRDMVGADRILFGSDQPSGKNLCVDKPFLKPWVDYFKNLPDQAAQYGYDFTPEEVDLILGKNAARLFNL